MSQNWMRHFELQIVNDKGVGIALSDFKVVFDITWTSAKFPRVANIKIYNLLPSTEYRIMNHEFRKIRIIAGYDGSQSVPAASDAGTVRPISSGDAGQSDGANYGLIFSGDIRYTLTGKGNDKDKNSLADHWLEIQAASEYEAYLYASVKTTLAAGYSVANMLDLTMRSFNPYGVTQGVVSSLSSTKFPRGLPIYSASRDVMDNIAQMCSGHWQMVDGQMHMVADDEYVQEAIVLSSLTGLIGMPKQENTGVTVTCLINPNIKVNGLVQIDQASVYRAELKSDLIAGDNNASNQGSSSPRFFEQKDSNGNLVVNGLSGSGNTKQQAPASIDSDGVYVVKKITCNGDTRGQNWYMTLTCQVRGASDSLASQSKSAPASK